MATACKNTNQKCIKSRRYRERMKTELQALRSLLPRVTSCDDAEVAEEVDKKMDAQTVVKVTLSYLKTKALAQTSLGRDWTPAADSSLFLDSFFDAILFVLSDALVVQYVVGDIQRLLGLKAFELLQTDLRKSMHQDDAAALTAALNSSPNSPIKNTFRFLTLKTSSSYSPLSCSLKPFNASSSQTRYVLVCEPDTQQLAGADQQPPAINENTLQSFWSEHTLSLNTTRNDASLDRLFGRHNLLQNKSLYELVHPAYVNSLATLHRDLMANMTKRCDGASAGKRARRCVEDEVSQTGDSANSGSLVDLLLEFPVVDNFGVTQFVSMRVRSRASLANRNKRQKSIIIAHKIVSLSIKSGATLSTAPPPPPPPVPVPVTQIQQPYYGWYDAAERWDSALSTVSSPMPSQDVPNSLDLSLSPVCSWNYDQKLQSPTSSSTSGSYAGVDSLLPSIQLIWKSEGCCATSAYSSSSKSEIFRGDFDFDTSFDLCNL